LADASSTPDRTTFRRPTLLRFASDDFMDEFMNVLDNEPERLGDWQAVWETWRQPAPISPPAESPLALPLKLYQPAHQRYYLITACMVCRVPGMPDRVLDVNRGEQVSFVVRRLKREAGPAPGETEFPTTSNLDSFAEYAFVATAQGYRWQRVGLTTDPQGEERLPLFGVSYTASDDRKRRLLSGLVPVGKREAYVAADTVEDDDTETEGGPDPRWVLFYSDVVRPWQLLVEQDAKFRAEQGGNEAAVRQKVEEELARAGETNQDKIDAAVDQALLDYDKDAKQLADERRMASWYILLDFAEFLQRHLRDVWHALPDKTGQVEGAERELLQALQALSGGHTLGEALREIEKHRSQLEGAVLAYEEVPDLEGNDFWRSTLTYEPDDPSWLASFDLTDFASLVDEEDDDPSQLESRIVKALKSVGSPKTTVPPLPLAARQQKVESGESYWYVIRCVFERPCCNGLPTRVVMSEPSEPFQIASFFDPQAPARPIRISLPLDTSPAGLRKFAKNTAFVMSDVLACQVGQISNITLADLVLSVLPWPFHKPLPDPTSGPCRSGDADAGMVCSLSIPIVTLCALVLLIIMVNLFEYFFRWIKYFIVSFPIPGLKAKESA
jgi:hypothetical protein